MKIVSMKGTNVTIEVDGKKHMFDIQNMLVINDQQLSKEYTQQASTFSFFAVLEARAEKAMADVDLLEAQEYSAADEAARTEFKEAGAKFTEAVIKSQVLQNDAYLESRKVLDNAKFLYRLLRMINDSWRMRADMLVSLGAHARAEMGMTDMKIKALTEGADTTNLKAVLDNAKEAKSGE